MTDSERLTLIREVFDAVFLATDSFTGDDLGCELAYLFAAVAGANPFGPKLTNDRVEWSEEEHGTHLTLFRELFSTQEGQVHAVWQFIDTTSDDEEENS